MEFYVGLAIIFAFFINFLLFLFLIFLYIKHRKFLDQMNSVRALEDILHSDDDFGRITDTNIYNTDDKTFVVSTGRRDKPVRTW